VKRCRVVGRSLILASILFLIWSFVDVQVQRSHKPGYYDPENDLPRIAYDYFYVMAGVGVGCVLLYVASVMERQRK
jgi:hypothetical protein